MTEAVRTTWLIILTYDNCNDLYPSRQLNVLHGKTGFLYRFCSQLHHALTPSVFLPHPRHAVQRTG